MIEISWVTQMIIILVVLIVVFTCYKINEVQNRISFYEKQGVYVFPGARKWLLGNLPLFTKYVEVSKRGTDLDGGLEWMMQNIKEFVEKKEEVPGWSPIILYQQMHESWLIMSDPKIIGYLRDNKLYDKASKMDMVFHSRMKINVVSLSKCPEQIRRRKAMLTAFTGENMNILRTNMQSVLKDFVSNIKQNQIEEINLRTVVFQIFESTVSTYLFGKDTSSQKLPMHILQNDGSTAVQHVPPFDALHIAIQVSMAAIPYRAVFGERPVNNILKCSIDNWTTFFNFIDSTVRERIQSKDRNANYGNCVIDILNDFEVYQNDVTKISNEVVAAMFASTDTTRHNTTIILCHLIKNRESMIRVREEIKAYSQVKNTPDAKLLNPATEELSHFPYLKYAISESLRFSPPLHIMDNYKILQDAQVEGMNFKKDQQIKFYIYGMHHNPNEWQQHDKFLPQRFDPSDKLYLTPQGKPRHEMSFMPFGLGDRKCIGYKFAEFVVPILAMNLINNFDFEFCDKSMMDQNQFPVSSVLCQIRTPLNIKIKPVL